MRLFPAGRRAADDEADKESISLRVTPCALVGVRPSVKDSVSSVLAAKAMWLSRIWVGGSKLKFVSFHLLLTTDRMAESLFDAGYVEAVGHAGVQVPLTT